MSSPTSNTPGGRGATPVTPPNRRRRLLLLLLLGAAAVIALLLLLSQCGGDDSNSTTSGTGTTAGSGTATTATTTPTESTDATTPTESTDTTTPTDSTGSTDATTPTGSTDGSTPTGSGDVGGSGDDAAGTIVSGDKALLTDTSVQQLAPYASKEAVGRAVLVQSVPADEGFWVGASATDRVWVQLTALKSESPFQVKVGDTVDFTGTVVPNASGFASKVGVTAAEGAGQLTSQAHHIEVVQSALTLSK